MKNCFYLSMLCIREDVNKLSEKMKKKTKGNIKFLYLFFIYNYYVDTEN